ncbi:hypothetical protein M758_9G108000 [Ceratodon purpureus]|uniref:Uncharacterized protein n=1 Tax=Ceratodon purpureus TaxID=3225 RepID=A0A8T0GS48_CERPU|nr:hypothetical protein KC19_9G093000 [Ceratodon purpureus]KAG0606033.1 hypothetical protein M758_9G108000 [Ceratodon purpureus]
MGYVETPDAAREGGFMRNCWRDIVVGRISSVKHFGDLIMMFKSLDDVDTTSDFVIKPEFYITLGGPPRRPRICFNIRVEPRGDDAFEYGNLGGEAMRGHLILFNEQPQQMAPSGLIGWRSVTSCKHLR